jgi:hypothetical protein
MMAPTVGRIVHYLDREEVLSHGEMAQPHAGIVTRVLTPARVNLNVFHPELGSRPVNDVDFGDHVGGWTWPPMASGAPALTAKEPPRPPQAAAAEPPADGKKPRAPRREKAGAAK